MFLAGAGLATMLFLAFAGVAGALLTTGAAGAESSTLAGVSLMTGAGTSAAGVAAREAADGKLVSDTGATVLLGVSAGFL